MLWLLPFWAAEIASSSLLSSAPVKPPNSGEPDFDEMASSPADGLSRFASSMATLPENHDRDGMAMAAASTPRPAAVGVKRYPILSRCALPSDDDTEPCESGSLKIMCCTRL